MRGAEHLFGIDRLAVARVRGADAVYIHTGHPDIYSMQVFDADASDEARSLSAIREQIERNVRNVPRLSLRVAAHPLRTDLPYWVPDPAPVDAHVVEVDAWGKSWAECMPAIASIVGVSLDPFVSCWCVHVLRGVRGLPGASGVATVTAHLGGPPTLAQSVLGVGRTVAGATALAVSALTGQRSKVPVRQGSTAGGGNVADGAVRKEVVPSGPISVRVFVVPLNDLRVPGFTVTLVLLTAISFALERYSAETGVSRKPYLYNVPMAVPDSFVRAGMNKISGALVTLRVDVAVLGSRAQAVRDNLIASRVEATGPARAELFRSMDRTPGPLIRAFAARSAWLRAKRPMLPGTHAKLASYTAGEADLELAGARLLFVSSVPGIGFGIKLAHNGIGVGGLVGISVTSTEDLIENPDRYEQILRDALAEVVQELRPRTGGIDGGVDQSSDRPTTADRKESNREDHAPA
ncbi:MAG: hypothetical protein U5O16_22195 [Rhodococcus sp. (in: high G+C Gram-positive bacteria)]|uniref:hypothetical protein n=1 Tax=Rhodococcus sp. TaxID=1831 RepID=UPI002AD963E0|nr:hypothetical protein [Rhodococcus sp. (in: high G+C Gram-positive bacteria)]